MAFFTRATAHFIYWEILLPRAGFRSWVRRTRPERLRRLSQQFCNLAVQLGGVWIKVGQFLSSRLDILPPEVTSELARLQDEVPMEDFSRIRQLAETELGATLFERYENFEEIPLAAASLGQVHRARLHPAEAQVHGYQEVVVKIQRPAIGQIIEVDLSALRKFGSWLERYPPIRKRADISALIEEFSSTIWQEIDYIKEGRNAEIFAKNFEDDSRVHVPRVVWNLTTQRVLTLENVYAIKITDYDAITAAGIDRAQVARVLLSVYLKQIFEDSFFHADPHPGNLFVTPQTDSQEAILPSWRLTFVDFGMIGQVPANLRQGLRELLIGIGMRDAARVVHAYQILNMLLPGADLKLIEQAEAQLFDRFWGMSMSELRRISPKEALQFAVQFRELIYSLPFQIPHDLLLLGRTIAILSGLCTGLDPDINVWEQVVPYAQEMLAAETQPAWRAGLEELGHFLRILVTLPGQTSRVLTQMEQGQLIVQMPQIAQQIRSLEVSINRLTASLIFATLFLGSILLFIAGHSNYAAAGLIAAFITLIYLLISSRKR